MASRLQDIKSGTVTFDDFIYWISERTAIWKKKEVSEPKPWTEDTILQTYKFTNAYRQLDKGTVALNKMLEGQTDPVLIFFNIVWYRFFNWYEHAENLGFVYNFTELEQYIRKCKRTHKKIFTGAHMTTGVAYEDKYVSYLRASKLVWDKRHYFSQILLGQKKMENAFILMLEIFMVGRFVAYELVCDLRFTPLLENATDKLTWANMGPGAQRGLKRLGLPHKNQKEGLESMIEIYERIIGWPIYSFLEDVPVPFELREVEHSLCEFDKYCRVKFGEGRPRSKYNGKA